MASTRALPRRLLTTRVYAGKSTVCDGWGIFADSYIPAGDVIDESPGMILNEVTDELRWHLWDDGHDAILPKGLGLLVNHSDTPNAEVWIEGRVPIIRLIALRALKPDEEILVDYQGDEAP